MKWWQVPEVPDEEIANKTLKNLQEKIMNPSENTTEEKKEKLVLFYGFSGRLKNKFSLIQDMSQSDLSYAVEILNGSGTLGDINIKLFTENMFMKNALDKEGDVLQNLEALKKEGYEMLPFEEATLAIRTQPIKKVEDVPFEEAEEEEMDENCVVGCSPGDHNCGK